jgi:hypothetical protein
MAMACAESSGVPRPLAGGYVFPGWLKRDVLMVFPYGCARYCAPYLKNGFMRAGKRGGAVKYRARLKGDRDEHVSHEPASITNQARNQLAACG